jgi:hypothetical protein
MCLVLSLCWSWLWSFLFCGSLLRHFVCHLAALDLAVWIFVWTCFGSSKLRGSQHARPLPRDFSWGYLNKAFLFAPLGSILDAPKLRLILRTDLRQKTFLVRSGRPTPLTEGAHSLNQMLHLLQVAGRAQVRQAADDGNPAKLDGECVCARFRRPCHTQCKQRQRVQA